MLDPIGGLLEGICAALHLGEKKRQKWAVEIAHLYTKERCCRLRRLGGQKINL